MTLAMIVTLFTTFTLTCVVAWWLVRAGGAFGLVDHPNQRSLHAAPTPRSGGLAIWAGAGVGTLLLLASHGGRPEMAWIGLATLAVGVVSLLDDRSHVPAGLRLIVHAFAAGLLVTGGLSLGTIALPGMTIELSTISGGFITLILVIWLTNLYNFMDGMDGLAGAMAVFGFGTLGGLGWLAGDGDYAALCWLIAAAAGGFLLWNLPPARLFMGDHGASVLGLLAAAMALWGDRLGLFPLWVALLAFAPFLADATVTLVRRSLRRERVWQAHRTHYYQRLARAGLGHRGTLWWELALMTVCAGAALVAVNLPVPGQWSLIALVGALLAAAMLAVHAVERRVGTPQ